MNQALVARPAGPIRRPALLFLAAVIVLVVAVVPYAASAAPAGAADTIEAVFEGRPIDLSNGWGEAQACVVWNDASVVECFRTEEEMDKRIAELEGELVSKLPINAQAQCSGYMRLYKDSSYSGQVLYIRDRLQWINLSAYSFSNVTSSFKIGPCSTYLADGDSGGGSWYPTSQSEAWDVAPSMASGWNDRISSVYIQ
jgi:hypothetical protein